MKSLKPFIMMNPIHLQHGKTCAYSTDGKQSLMNQLSHHHLRIIGSHLRKPPDRKLSELNNRIKGNLFTMSCLAKHSLLQMALLRDQNLQPIPLLLHPTFKLQGRLQLQGSFQLQGSHHKLQHLLAGLGPLLLLLLLNLHLEGLPGTDNLHHNWFPLSKENLMALPDT